MEYKKQQETGLSSLDVEKLLTNPSPEARTETADKVSKQFASEGFSKSERAIAEEIFKLMAKDIEVQVRLTLSQNLHKSAHLSREVAMTLAKDIDEVALPILEFSEVLTDDDLVEIVHEGSNTKQTAIAKRSTVTEKVSTVLIEQGQETTISTLLSNTGAQISEQSYTKALERFPDSPMVNEPMALRSQLPISIAESLVVKVSLQLQNHILSNYDLNPDIVANIILQTREKTTISLSSTASEKDTDELISQLIQNNRLTPSILIRSLCMGECKFFEHSISALTKLPLYNVQVLIYDSGELGFKSLYEKTKLPPSLYPAFAAAVEVIKETDLDGEQNDKERFSRRIIERILTQIDSDSNINMNSSDIEYLLAKIGELPPSYLETIEK